MKLRPFADRIVVRRQDSEQKIGSIVIPVAAQEESTLGLVVAVGPGRMNDAGECVPNSARVGDIVMFGKTDGTNITFEGETYVLLREHDIQGAVE